MNKKESIWDKYAIYVWGLVILLVATIMFVPFIPGQITRIFGIYIYYTPVLILSPVLMGIIYAVVASYETQNMSPKKKKVFRTIKIVDFAVFYALSIAVIVFAAVQGRINF